MKNIAVLIYGLTVEYSLDILSGITDYFNDKDVKLIIAQTKDPHCDMGVYEYQCWASTEYLFSAQIDGYIILGGSYASTITSRALSKFLEKIGNRPIVSIGMELNLPNAYVIKTKCENAYIDVIKHLKERHDCKKIAFMSANLTKSAEAADRFNAYKKALEVNNLEFDETLVLNGAYTKTSARKAINDAYKSKEEVPFDAILCANDLMAVGTQSALQELGICVSVEIRVFGFDDTSHAVNVKPKLSTISQNIYEQGMIASATLEKVLDGIECERVIFNEATPVYRQSCGCIPMENLESVYLDRKELLRYESDLKTTKIKVANKQLDYFASMEEIYTLFDMAKSASTLRKTYSSIGFMINTASIDSIAVFFFDKPEIVQKEDDIIIPEKMRLSMVISKNEEDNDYEPGIIFSPQKELMPEKLFAEDKGLFMLQPVFSGEATYGYILCKLKNTNFSLYSVFAKILINTLTQGYEFTNTLVKNVQLEQINSKLQQDNSTLDKRTKTDELTRILNRRGFMEQGQKTIDYTLDSSSKGLVFFADMDGLKTINDTYGHKTGDKAIKAMASVLTKAFRANDVVGRLSGDEFGIVAPGLALELQNKLRNKVNELCIEESKVQELPFVLSCSFGAVEFSSTSAALKELLTKADENLYVEKRIKHSQKKSD